MLRQLTIHNIVLIKELSMTFDKGLTVLTGETGAGKSILLDAIGLILGKRAEARLVRAGESKASVVAEFYCNIPNIVTRLADAGIETDDTLIIRRNITADGTSKAYINDHPVTLKLLRDIGEQLITIHGQHGQKGLLDPTLHQQLLDDFSHHHEMLLALRTHYATWKKALKDRQRLIDELEQTAREQEYLEHIIKELSALHPEEGEEEILATKRSALMQAEKIGRLLRDAEKDLNGAVPVSETLHKVQLSLMRSSIADTDACSAIVDGLERTLNELADTETALATMIRDDAYDEMELERTEERLFALREAARKHRVSADELPHIYNTAKEKLDHITHSTEALSLAEQQVTQSRAAYIASATALRNARNTTIPQLVNAIESELAPLKMEATRFRVSVNELEEHQWHSGGMDSITFEVSTNPGSPFGGLHDIASGGELSRFMLAVAVVLGAESESGHSMLIFDEIDTGTGGAVADAIGARLAMLSQHRQVAVVTHLPQVAARGNAHYFIQKSFADAHTSTSVSLLTDEARHEELARMLSGASITSEARQAAARLLELADTQEQHHATEATS